MRLAKLDVVEQEVRPGRPNIVGTFDTRAPGGTCLLCGHIDTVGVDGMADPFVARIEQGRLYGRGAQDMKGGIAAMIAAAAILTSRMTAGKLLVACVVDEEHESLGAEALVREWRADAAVVTEPTDLALVIAHKGFAWLEVTTKGRAAHGSRPRDGRDAIMAMGRVLAHLGALDAELQSRPPVPLTGTGSLHASIIEGGRELSSYPDSCVLQLERRTLDGETGDTALAEIASIVGKLRQSDPDFEASARLLTFRPAYQLDPSHDLAAAAASALRAAGRSETPTGTSFWTDAAVLGSSGIPTVLLGPGGAGLHSPVEYVNIDDVYACRDLLVEIGCRVTAAPGGARGVPSPGS
jgi:acetylornithine deacetylase